MTTTTRLFVTKWCLVFLASAVGWSATAFAAAAPSHKLNEGTSAQPADIEVFVREGCPHCARAEVFLAALKQEQPDLQQIRDVLKDLLPRAISTHCQNQGVATVSVPAIAGGGN